MSWFSKETKNSHHDWISAIDQAQAIIEFTPEGQIIFANRNFLSTLKYELSEIQGQHHSLFVEPAYKDSPEYAAFWQRLKNGETFVDQFKRIRKDKEEVWVEASYNPIRDTTGKVVRVVKFAIDVTTQKKRLTELEGQVNAINRSQAVISFDMDGTITDANENFLSVLGYRLDEIKGKHHRIFVAPEETNSAAYGDFWAALNRGQFQQAQYKRIGKGGKEVWIEASYNPIFDANGVPYKVVKFATDISDQMTVLADLKQLIDVNFEEIKSAITNCTHEAGTATQASSDASTNVQTMASASEELAASIHEISSSMSQSQASADQAFEHTNAAEKAAARLAETAGAMTNIVGMIQNIAGQINLLALNATIESARAGDAGKGFAVVANEVKNLANQAARATDEISKEIEGIQGVSDQVVSTLSAIQQSVETVQKYVGATAAAVEEQSTVTQDMSLSMQSASQLVTNISENITTITSAISQVEQSVDTTLDAAQVLAR